MCCFVNHVPSFNILYLFLFHSSISWNANKFVDVQDMGIGRRGLGYVGRVARFWQWVEHNWGQIS